MEEKEKTFLEVSPKEQDFRLLIADDLLTKMPPEERLNVFKEMFMMAAKNHNDEAASELLSLIGKEYQRKERKISDETYHHYGNADNRADADFCEYLRSIYWELPDKKKVSERRQHSSPYEYIPEYGPALLQTKAKIIELWMKQWARYDYNTGQKCFKEVNKESLRAFRFLIAVYAPRGKDWLKQPYESEDEIKARGRMVFKEEQDEIFKLFRETTDVYFTPEIAEKWLKMPNVPEEIRKIFRIAWIRNGGQELFDRCMKNAEIVKSLEKISALSILSAENK